jgi:two-component system OmpR family response regulator
MRGWLRTRPALIQLMRGTNDAIAERTIDLLVSRLRRKLAQGGHQLELIRTVRSDGYLFDPDLTGERNLLP